MGADSQAKIIALDAPELIDEENIKGEELDRVSARRTPAAGAATPLPVE